MRTFHEQAPQAPMSQPLSAFARLTESVEYIGDVRNSITVHDWLKFAEYYSECFAEQQIVALQSQVQWGVDQTLNTPTISQQIPHNYGIRMASDPYATAGLLDALFQESIDWEFDTPDRTWADLGTGTGILAVALALRARRMGSPKRHIIGIDFNASELGVAKILAERLGISQIQYIHGDLENDQFLSSIFSNAKTFPSLIACELIGNRKNYLHEEGDSYTATIIRLHRLLAQYQIAAWLVRTVPRAVYASLFNSERSNHFWPNSPTFRLSLNGPEVIYGATPHPNAREFAEPELAYLRSLYAGTTHLSSLTQYKQLGIHSITLDAEWGKQSLHEVGENLRPVEYTGPRRWS